MNPKNGFILILNKITNKVIYSDPLNPKSSEIVFYKWWIFIKKQLVRLGKNVVFRFFSKGYFNFKYTRFLKMQKNLNNKKIFSPLIIFLLLICFYSFAKIEFKGNSLAQDSSVYRDVSLTNLPLAAVTGAGMDVECADIDNDGDLDVFLAIEYFPNKLLLNNGSGVFTDVSAARLPQKNLDSEDIAIADFDNDGDLDVVFATEDHRIHEYYLNNGQGFFNNDVSARLPNSTANSVLAHDVNNDSIPDLIFGNANPGDTPGQNFVLINNGDGTFRDESVARLGAVLDVTQDIKMGDLDDDGDKDMVVGNEDGNKLYINNGSGFFMDETASRLPLPVPQETRKVTLDDIDFDGDLDIYFANVNFLGNVSAQDRLLMNDSTGRFTDETSTRLFSENLHTLEGIFLDYDFDGDKDLITALGFTSQPVLVYENTGGEIFNITVPPKVIPAGMTGNCLGFKTADYNRDGFPDIYVVNRGQRDILLFRNDTATVGIGSQFNEIPEEFKLFQNYPNPFNPETVISFEISKTANISLDVYDISGKKLFNLLNDVKNEGSYSITVDVSKYNLSSGIYFYSLKSNAGVLTKTMMVVK
ncbi:MAG TPA: T9SS type A sorting domain-containing protein [Ignavibacteria bacterium]|nr:T9SS type A sorting domain-containing protein [Ignavibacteria bacterium]